MTEAIHDETLSFKDLSIDEIFTQNSIHSVKNLQREYNANVKKSKADLHSLVGSKYRDLIQIAEDIDKMSNMSRNIEDRLTHLSYKTPSHVLFGSSPYSKFDTSLRNRNAREARVASRTTIFNNLVNKKLLSFDLKLQGSNKIDSRSCLRMAKVYFTIEYVLASHFSPAALEGAAYSEYKEAFNQYLEHKISSLVPHLVSSSTVITRGTQTQWLESENVDFFSDFLEEEQDEISDDEIEFDSSKSSRYFGNSNSPMSNYIVAYIILNHTNQSNLETVARKIIDLRLQHLRNLISGELENSPEACCNMNFSFFIAFLESTFSCIRKYFLESGTEEIGKLLCQSSTWKASELIGFHNWFENEQVSFENTQYTSLKINFLKSLDEIHSEMSEYVFEVFKAITTNENQSEPTKYIVRALSLLHNFITASRKAEVLLEANESECLTAKIFSRSDLFQKLTKFVTSYVRTLLNTENGFIRGEVLTQIQDNFEDPSRLDTSTRDFFDPDVIDSIDSNFERYFEQILRLTSTLSTIDHKSNNSDGIETLEQWFERQKTLLRLILPEDSSLLSGITKFLKKPYPNAKSFELWGTFTINSFQLAFLHIEQEKIKALNTEIGHLLEEICSTSEKFTDISTLEKTHYVLHLAHTLRSNHSLYSDKTLYMKIDKLLETGFRHLFDSLDLEKSDRSSQILELLTSPRVLETIHGSGTVPACPNFIVDSCIGQVASKLSSSKYLSSAKIFSIILCAENKAIFVGVKNKWVHEMLVKSLMLNGSKFSISSEADTLNVAEETEKPVEQEEEGGEIPLESGAAQSSEELNKPPEANPGLLRARQWMANLAFLISLTSAQPLVAQDPHIAALREEVNGLSKVNIEDTTLEVIIRGVNECYKANKDLYLPLLIN